MLTRNQVFKLNNEIVNESFAKFGDSYRGQIIVDIPKSLINAVRSKSKKELSLDTVENYSDISICDLIMEYIKSTYLNIESIPVSKLFGLDAVGEPNDVMTDVIPEEQTEPVVPQEPINTMDEVETDVQPTENEF